jgi:hypothetical protein
MGKILAFLRVEGGAGTCGVGVKSVEIARNAEGEGRHLVYF